MVPEFRSTGNVKYPCPPIYCSSEVFERTQIKHGIIFLLKFIGTYSEIKRALLSECQQKKIHSKLSATGDDAHPDGSRSLLKDPKFILIAGLHVASMFSMGFPLAAFYSEQAQGWVFSCYLEFVKEHRLIAKFSGNFDEDKLL